jgi:hypothetical protein
MMTVVSVAKDAVGVTTGGVKGTGMLSFIKYENRAISVAITTVLLAGGAIFALSGTSSAS